MKLIKSAELAGVLLGVTLLAACGSGASSSDTTSNQKVELTFWSWVPNIDKVVEVWNGGHPNIHVTVSKQAQGDEQVTKVLTAAKAGNRPTSSRPSTRPYRPWSATTSRRTSRSRPSR
jgi:multiple sugar transport system substrate-binding protein